jgi:hypothetical protein
MRLPIGVRSVCPASVRFATHGGLKGLRVVEFDASPHRSQRHMDQALSFLLAKCSNSGCI